MTRRNLSDLPLSQQAGILCGDNRFQEFAARQSGVDGRFTESASAEYLRRQCRIISRRELDTNDGAAEGFNRLRTEFDAFTGRIAAQKRTTA